MQQTEGRTTTQLKSAVGFRRNRRSGFATKPTSAKKPKFRAMTLIELMVTMTIMAVLLAISTPALAALQGRQALVNGQRELQTALYTLNQHTLSPPQNDNTNYVVVGYGLAFLPGGPLTVGGNCSFTDTAKRDLLVLYKFTVSNSNANIGQVVPVFNGLNPGDPCDQLKVSQYPDDIFPLPNSVRFNKHMIDTFSGSSPTIPFGAPSPWLIAMPLYSAGDAYGPAFTSYYAQDNFSNPLPDNNSNQTVVLVNKGIRVNGSYLCRGVTISRSSNGFAATSGSLLSNCTLQ